MEIEVDTRWPLYTVDWNHLTRNIAVAGGDKKIRIYSFDFDSESLVQIGSFSLNDEINGLKWNPSPYYSNLIGAACDNGFVYILRFSP